jgi:DNA invertase Pin-like site-specific DNA recombinase
VSQRPKHTNDQKVIAAYLRKSTKEQNLAGQRAQIMRWFKGHDIDPHSVRWFIDEGESGDTLDRPALNDLRHAIFMGEVGTVVMMHLDCLSRSIRDGINVLCDWIDQKLRIVCTSTEIDFNGTNGRIIAAVLLGLAEGEQNRRKERQRDGIEAARDKVSGKCHWGGRQKGTYKAKPGRAAELRQRGLTIPEIATALGVSHMSVHRYLRLEAK